jgi:hypothetical protein
MLSVFVVFVLSVFVVFGRIFCSQHFSLLSLMLFYVFC